MCEGGSKSRAQNLAQAVWKSEIFSLFKLITVFQIIKTKKINFRIRPLSVIRVFLKPLPSMHFSDIKNNFKRYALFEKGIKSLTIKAILRSVEKLDDYLSTNSVQTITTTDIRSFLYHEKETKLWANKTFRNNRQYLKSFFDYCVAVEIISVNPVLKIEKPKLPKSLPRSLRKDEIHKILLHTDSISWNSHKETLRNQTIIRTFLFTGIRLSELLNLKISEINLAETKILIKKGKGDKDRIIPIHPQLLPFLQQHLSFKRVSPFVFSSMRSEKALTKKNLYRIIQKIRNSSQVYFSPHMLRHTFGKLSIESNLNPFKLKAIMGHSDISTTQIYVSISNQNIHESFQKLQLI